MVGEAEETEGEAGLEGAVHHLDWWTSEEETGEEWMIRGPH